MFVPLLVLDGLLAVVLVALLVRRSRVRARANAAEARLSDVEARVGQALDAVRRAEPAVELDLAVDGRPEPPAERRRARRVRRVAPPATPDRP